MLTSTDRNQNTPDKFWGETHMRETYVRGVFEVIYVNIAVNSF